MFTASDGGKVIRPNAQLHFAQVVEFHPIRDRAIGVNVGTSVSLVESLADDAVPVFRARTKPEPARGFVPHVSNIASVLRRWNLPLLKTGAVAGKEVNGLSCDLSSRSASLLGKGRRLPATALTEARYRVHLWFASLNEVATQGQRAYNPLALFYREVAAR